MIRTSISTVLISLALIGSYASAQVMLNRLSPQQIQQMLEPMPLIEAQQMMQGLVQTIKEQLTEDEYTTYFLPGLGLAQSAFATVVEAACVLLDKHPALAELFSHVDVSTLAQKDKRGMAFLSGMSKLPTIAHKIDDSVKYEMLAVSTKLQQLALGYVSATKNPAGFDACMNKIKGAALAYCAKKNVAEATLAKSIVTVFSADSKLDHLFSQLHKTIIVA